MLVLARQRDQTVIIGDDIEVTVVDVRGDKVRLGINAPRNVSVHRKEVYEAIRREKQAAANSKSAASPSNSPPSTPAVADEFLRAAIDEARTGLSEGGLPIGSVLVRDGKIIGRGHNRRVQQGDPMAHAEIDCLRHAGRQSTYKDTVLYSTLMPCHLCSGAVVQFGIPKVIVGESANFHGAPEFMRQHGVQVVDLRDPECTRMMADFIHAHPQLWNEDIGKG
jgi:cytosine deaminase